MSEPILSIRGLHVRLSRDGRASTVLDGIDVDVAAGEVIVLVGESGSGKSTIGLALKGLLPTESMPELSGSIRLSDREIIGAKVFGAVYILVTMLVEIAQSLADPRIAL